eukprot:scaffold26019_cov147-Cylindrotheca_fusiformis.AAC.1
MLVLEARAIDNFFYSWLVVVLNALLAAILNKVTGLEMSHDLIQQWDMVYSLVLKTSLAFLLVFRLNRCAMRFWDARGHWGSITHITRNLVGGIIMYCGHSPRHRDMAIRWASAFCVATMHFIRNEPDYSFDELAGILSTDQIKRMKDANHSALFAASMCRYHLRRAFKIDSSTPAQLAHAYSVQMISLEQQVARLVEQEQQDGEDGNDPEIGETPAIRT